MLRVKRISAWSGKATKMDIYLNGNKADSVKDGKECVISYLENGKNYDVRIKGVTGTGETETVNFKYNEGTDINLECGYNKTPLWVHLFGPLGFIVTKMIGYKYLYLKRV